MRLNPGLLLAGLMFWQTLSTTEAAENGGSNYLPGFYGDFGLAVAPPTGTYLSNFAGYFTGSDATGDSSLLFELPGVIRVTHTQIAGGHYWFGFFPYVLRTTYNGVARSGAGDMYALPALLSWQWGDLSLLAFEGVVVPTGEFDPKSLVNGGRHYWTFDSNVALTWHPAQTDYEFSAVLGHMVNTQNAATDYRTGDELHFDYFAGHYPRADVGLGVAGSYYTQIAPDTGRGVPDGLPLAEYSSIGPALMYTVKLGSKEVVFSLKWLHEYNVNNHIPGDYMILRTLLSF